MSTVQWIAVSLVALVVAVGAVVVLAALLLRRLAVRGVQDARARYPDARLVVPGASFFGQQSRGMAQTRGNGTLIFTASELIFVHWWVPAPTLRIPLAAIEAVDSPTAFLGKTRFTPLLRVDWRTDSGGRDAAAWQVPDLDAVRRALTPGR